MTNFALTCRPPSLAGFVPGAKAGAGGGFNRKGTDMKRTHLKKRTYQVRCRSGLMGWRARLRNNYPGGFTDWLYFADMWGLEQRLGFKTAQAAWRANPVVEGSVNPSDFRKVKP
jgi:hypothetical protein